jgi:hypothetical protein
MFSNTLGYWWRCKFLQRWVRIQKPVVTYDIVTCDKKAVFTDLFATLPNVFDD